MEDTPMTSPQLIAEAYRQFRPSVLLYILYKVNNREEAEDLTQDVFLRLMDYSRMLRPETVKCFIFTIARNLVYDYLRRYYKAQEVTSYIYDRAETATRDTESGILARDLQACEVGRMRLLPPQRRKVYALSRFGGKSAADISRLLGLSRRTVENHLFISRKEIREYMQQCI